MTLYLSEDIKKHVQGPDIFAQMMALRGECFRHQEGRLTQRVTLGGKSYFLKQHTGVGWKEIFKNLLQGRAPVLGAKNEWLAIQKLQTLGVNVAGVAAYGQRGLNPARRQSFILMEELAPVISLETLCQTWRAKPPTFAHKRRLIEDMAVAARLLHENGMNHRDFYICHFLLNTVDTQLYLIDLHRTQMRRLTPARWIIKDLAGLYFSSKDMGFTQRDLYRFMQCYRQKPLREVVNSEKTFWQKVIRRGEKLYRDHQ